MKINSEFVRIAWVKKGDTTPIGYGEWMRNVPEITDFLIDAIKKENYEGNDVIHFLENSDPEVKNDTLLFPVGDHAIRFNGKCISVSKGITEAGQMMLTNAFSARIIIHHWIKAFGYKALGLIDEPKIKKQLEGIDLTPLDLRKPGEKLMFSLIKYGENVGIESESFKKAVSSGYLADCLGKSKAELDEMGISTLTEWFDEVE